MSKTDSIEQLRQARHAFESEVADAVESAMARFFERTGYDICALDVVVRQMNAMGGPPRYALGRVQCKVNIKDF